MQAAPQERGYCGRRGCGHGWAAGCVEQLPVVFVGDGLKWAWSQGPACDDVTVTGACVLVLFGIEAGVTASQGFHRQPGSREAWERRQQEAEPRAVAGALWDPEADRSFLGF